MRAQLTAGVVGRQRNTAATANTGSQKEAPPTIRYEDHIWAAGLPPPAGELSRAEPDSPQSAKDGEALFSSMNCDGCHSSDGSGYVGPSLSDGRWRYGGRDEEVFDSIFYGRPRGMPAYGGLLGQGGVWLMVSFLKSLPKPGIGAERYRRPSPGHPGPSGTAGAPTQ